MNHLLTPDRLLELLRRAPEQLAPVECLKLRCTLGEAARWLLCREALTCLAEEYPLDAPADAPPRLPTEAGTCCVVYAVEQPEVYPLVRPAFALPLQWCRGGSDDPGLPGKLRALAARIRQQLGISGWSLHRFCPFDHVDLAGFDPLLTHESGWAPLTVGLMVAAKEGTPRSGVWATGRWDDSVMPISELEAKLALAHRWQVEEMFVPGSQAEEAKCLLTKMGAVTPRIDKLEEGKRDPHDAVRHYYARLFGRPAPTDPITVRCGFYESRDDETNARHYFVDDLLEDIAAKCLQELDRSALQGITHLLTVASDSWELVPLIVRILKPKACRILFSKEKQAALDEARVAVHRVLPNCDLTVGCFDMSGDLFGQFAKLADSFGSNLSPDCLALDLTPGNKEMSLAMNFTAAGPGNRLVYLRHQRQGSKVVPMSQRLLVRIVGEGPV